MSDEMRLSSVAREGMRKGGKAGFYLSLTYNLAFPFIWYYTDPSRSIAEPDTGILLTAAVTMPFYGLVIGCLPATILGGITGWLVGKAFSLMFHRLTPLWSVTIGCGIAICIALVLNSFVVFDPRQPSPWLWNWSYLVLLGIPTLIYMAVAPVISYRLYRS